MERGVYQAPEWSAVPLKPWTLHAVRGGVICEEHELHKKPFYLLGTRPDVCDIVYPNPAVSRVHAALQFNAEGKCFVVDLQSTAGSFVHDQKLEPYKFHQVEPEDRLAFGAPASKSKRIWLLQSSDVGPLLPRQRAPPELLFQEGKGMTEAAVAELYDRIGQSAESNAPEILEEKADRIYAFWKASRLDVGAMQREGFWDRLTEEEKRRVMQIDQRQKYPKEGEETVQELFDALVKLMEEQNTEEVATLSNTVKQYLDQDDDDTDDDDGLEMESETADQIEQELERCRRKAEELKQTQATTMDGDAAATVDDALDAYMVYNSRKMVSHDLKQMSQKINLLEAKLLQRQQSDDAKRDTQPPGAAAVPEKNPKQLKRAAALIARIAAKRSKPRTPGK